MERKTTRREAVMLGELQNLWAEGDGTRDRGRAEKRVAGRERKADRLRNAMCIVGAWHRPPL